MDEIAETILTLAQDDHVSGCGSDRMPAALAGCHESLRMLYSYWDEKRGQREMPGRADIDPVDLKPLLPLLCLVDLVKDERRYVYRLVGTRDVEMRGHNPTGKAVGEAYYGESAAQTTAYFDRVVATRRPLLYRGTFRPWPTRIETDEVIYLPLSRDGREIDMIMLYSHTLWIKDETPFPVTARQLA
jgi:hypothetical protein